MCSTSPWSESEPKLTAELMALSDSRVAGLLNSSDQCEEWLRQIVPDYVQALSSWRPESKTHERQISQPPLAAGIPGRKWQQINYFSDLLNPLSPATSNLDWCSGKGYLATTLEHIHGLAASHCLEIDHSLCIEGRHRAEKFSLKTAFHCCDVLQPLPSKILALGKRHTGLHACGELHRSLLKQAGSVAEQIVVAPCCYHLFSDKPDNRLSVTAQQLPLVFDRDTLRIPLLETVTGGSRVQRLRATEITWRHAYEAWRGEVTEEETYRPLASVPKAVFNQEPSEFFQWAAQQHGLEWDSRIDVDPYLRLGRERFLFTERLGIVRQGLKRYLEYLLVLDLGCYLEEQGFDVSITEFCPKNVTPRNLAIVAVKS